jgi:K+-sensing histidine kinase KdpD
MRVEDAEGLFYAGAGPLAAILLGIALVPVRGLTPAANLSFAFIALTIVVAELGGRWAAMATALVSALSLDFFLTQPYLRLAIEDKHDVIAFLGLTVCGLIAAALGSHQRDAVAALRAVEKQHDLLRSVLRDWRGSDSIGPQLTVILQAARNVFPLAAAVIRDDQNRVLASTDPAVGLHTVPDAVLQPDTLLTATGSDTKAPRTGLALPENGGRIALVAGARSRGWLDIWGDGAWATAASRRGLSDLARLLAVLLASDPRTHREADPEQ